MTVAQLIAELQKMPQQKTATVVMSGFHINDETGEWLQELDDSDAVEAIEVQDIGGCVLIRSK